MSNFLDMLDSAVTDARKKDLSSFDTQTLKPKEDDNSTQNFESLISQAVGDARSARQSTTQQSDTTQQNDTQSSGLNFNDLLTQATDQARSQAGNPQQPFVPAQTQPGAEAGFFNFSNDFGIDTDSPFLRGLLTGPGFNPLVEKTLAGAIGATGSIISGISAVGSAGPNAFGIGTVPENIGNTLKRAGRSLASFSEKTGGPTGITGDIIEGVGSMLPIVAASQFGAGAFFATAALQGADEAVTTAVGLGVENDFALTGIALAAGLPTALVEKYTGLPQRIASRIAARPSMRAAEFSIAKFLSEGFLSGVDEAVNEPLQGAIQDIIKATYDPETDFIDAFELKKRLRESAVGFGSGALGGGAFNVINTLPNNDYEARRATPAQTSSIPADHGANPENVFSQEEAPDSPFEIEDILIEEMATENALDPTERDGFDKQHAEDPNTPVFEQEMSLDIQEDDNLARQEVLDPNEDEDSEIESLDIEDNPSDIAVQRFEDLPETTSDIPTMLDERAQAEGINRVPKVPQRLQRTDIVDAEGRKRRSGKIVIPKASGGEDVITVEDITDQVRAEDLPSGVKPRVVWDVRVNGISGSVELGTLTNRKDAERLGKRVAEGVRETNLKEAARKKDTGSFQPGDRVVVTTNGQAHAGIVRTRLGSEEFNPNVQVELTSSSAAELSKNTTGNGGLVDVENRDVRHMTKADVRDGGVLFEAPVDPNDAIEEASFRARRIRRVRIKPLGTRGTNIVTDPVTGKKTRVNRRTRPRIWELPGAPRTLVKDLKAQRALEKLRGRLFRGTDTKTATKQIIRRVTGQYKIGELVEVDDRQELSDRLTAEERASKAGVREGSQATLMRVRAREEIKRLREKIRKAPSDNMDVEYKKALVLLQEGLDFQTRSKKKLEALRKLREFQQSEAEQGRKVSLPLGKVQQLSQTQVFDLSIDELRALAATADRMRALGRAVKRVRSAAQQKQDSIFKEALIKQVDGLKEAYQAKVDKKNASRDKRGRRPTALTTPRSGGRAPRGATLSLAETVVEASRNGAKSAALALKRPLDFFLIMDKENVKGPWHQLYRAADRAYNMWFDATQLLSDKFDGYASLLVDASELEPRVDSITGREETLSHRKGRVARKGRRLLTRELAKQTRIGDRSFNGSELVGIAMHAEGAGYERLTENGFIRVDGVEEVPLSDNEIAAIQDIVNSDEILTGWKQFLRKHWDRQGVRLQQASERVTGDIFVAEDLYTPLMSNKDADEDLTIDLMKTSTKAEAEDRQKITLPNWFTKNRVPGVTDRIVVDSIKMYSIQSAQAEHYIAFAETAQELRKIVNDKDIQDAVRKAWGHRDLSKRQSGFFNFDAVDYLKNWTSDAMMFGDPVGHSAMGASHFMRTMRRNLVPFAIGYKVTALLKQPISFINAAFEYRQIMGGGPGTTRLFAKTMVDYLTDRDAHSRMEAFANELDVIRNRAFDRDITEHARFMKNKGLTIGGSRLSEINSDIAESSLELIKRFDRATVITVGYAAFTDAQQRGFSAEEAMQIATDLILRTQPQGAKKDLPPIMRDGEIFKLMTFFTNQINQNFNQWARVTRNYRSNDIEFGSKNVATAVFMTGVIPSFIIALIDHGFGSDIDDPEDLVTTLPKDMFVAGVRSATAAVPGVAQIMDRALLYVDRGRTVNGNSLSIPADDVLTEISNSVTDILRGVKALAKGDIEKSASELGKAAVGGIEALALFRGVPFPAFKNAGEGIADDIARKSIDPRRLISSRFSRGERNTTTSTASKNRRKVSR